MEKAMVRQAVPLQPMEVNSGADIHGGPRARAGGCQKEAVTPWQPALEQAPGRTCDPMERGAHTGAGLLAGLVTLWGPTLEQSVPEGLHLMEETHAGAVHEELQPVGRTHIEVHGGLSPMGGTPCWSRGGV
ncbi:hypothetical protein GRJ2_001193100 [Grus japonensis]|uniref:Uncharacterized protein n=1 Tax=Grus japonensis TaxID=30415 RepID=A0ABC9WP87_GRUJA